LFFFYVILIAGIILSAIAPAISSIYSIPSEWIGLKPAMILFNRFTHENLENMNSWEEHDLEKVVKKYKDAADIISQHLSNSSELLRKYPEIFEAFQEVNNNIRSAEELQNVKRQEREEREKEEKQQRLRDKKRKRQEAETYRESVQQEREKRGLKYGVPPKDNTCPPQYPIRATAKLHKSDDARGIYYYEDERQGVKVYWCFASEEEAEADKFRRPYNTPTK